jgi:hypothetical protein
MATARKYTKTAADTNLTLEPNINTIKAAKILKHFHKTFKVWVAVTVLSLVLQLATPAALTCPHTSTLRLCGLVSPT